MEEKYWIIEGYFPLGYWAALYKKNGDFRIESWDEMQELWREYTKEYQNKLRVREFSVSTILWRPDIRE